VLSKTRGNVEVIKVAIKERNGTDLEEKKKRERERERKKKGITC